MKIDGLAHVGLFIQNVERSEEFYTKILGFDRVWQTCNHTQDGEEIVTFIRNGNLIIELVQVPKPEKRKDGWFDHIAMRVEDLDQVIEHIKKKGITFEAGSYTIAPHVLEHGSRWILLRGPDGEHLELNEQFF